MNFNKLKWTILYFVQQKFCEIGKGLLYLLFFAWCVIGGMAVVVDLIFLLKWLSNFNNFLIVIQKIGYSIFIGLCSLILCCFIIEWLHNNWIKAENRANKKIIEELKNESD